MEYTDKKLEIENKKLDDIMGQICELDFGAIKFLGERAAEMDKSNMGKDMKRFYDNVVFHLESAKKYLLKSEERAKIEKRKTE